MFVVSVKIVTLSEAKTLLSSSYLGAEETVAVKLVLLQNCPISMTVFQVAFAVQRVQKTGHYSYEFINL